jgi:hypothetical protein
MKHFGSSALDLQERAGVRLLNALGSAIQAVYITEKWTYMVAF